MPNERAKDQVHAHSIHSRGGSRARTSGLPQPLYAELRSTVYTLLVVAAVAVLLATLFLPVLQVSGDSMNPTLQDRDIILLVKGSDMKTGDLCGFYWQNKLLLKRIIGLPGDVIELDEDGVVTVNGQTLDEPYVDELALGECDIKFPIRCRKTGISYWVTIGPPPLTTAAV